MGESGHLVIADSWQVVLLVRPEAGPTAVHGFRAVTDQVLAVAVRVAQRRLGTPAGVRLELRPEMPSGAGPGDP